MRLSKYQMWLLKAGGILFVRGSATRISELAQEPGYASIWPIVRQAQDTCQMLSRGMSLFIEKILSENGIAFHVSKCAFGNM